MPIAQQGSSGGGGGTTLSHPFTAKELIPQGSLVAVTSTNGVAEIELAEPTTNGERALGFAITEIQIGEIGKFIVGRGALVTPVIVGGGTFTPNDPVFMAASGEVSQTPPTQGFVTMIGYATSTTELILTTDFRFIKP